MDRYTTPVIYYGCRRDKTLSEALQPRNYKAEWFIYFKHIHPATGKYKPVKRKLEINRFHKPKEKETGAKEALQSVISMLHSGWSPFGNGGNDELLTFDKALDYALNVKKADVSHRSYLGYHSIVEMVKAKAKQMHIVLDVKNVRRRHVKDIVTALQVERGFGNTRYNAIIECIRSLFTVLLDEERIELHPLTRMVARPREAPKMFQPLTAQEKRLFFEEVAPAHPAFFTFCMCIYHAGIRPKELLSLKVRDYDRNEGIITIRSGGKTFRKMGERLAPVTSEMAALLSVHIDGSDPDHFIFGKGFLPQRRDKAMHRNEATELWQTLVKKGLSINKDMYGLKHTGGDDKILADMPEDWLMEIFGHASKSMSAKYARNKKKILLKKISASSPNFLPEQEPGKG